MHDILNYLEQLELSDIEAKLYLTLLETGPTSVRDLAKKVGVNRTSIYIYIDRLTEKGLIIKVVKGSRSQVAANPPKETLPHLIAHQLQKTKTLQDQLPKMLQIFPTSPTSGGNADGAEIKYYQGKFGVRKIYEEALKAKEIRSYVNIEEIAEVFPDNFSLFDNAFKQNPTMKMFEIVEDSPQARERVKTSGKREKYSYKILPKKMKFTAQDILIYENKVAIIHFKDKIHGLLLHNTDLYNNFKVLFEYIWNTIGLSVRF